MVTLRSKSYLIFRPNISTATRGKSSCGERSTTIWRCLPMWMPPFACLYGRLSRPLGTISFRRLRSVRPSLFSCHRVEAEILAFCKLREADKLLQFVSISTSDAGAEAIAEKSLDVFQAAWKYVWLSRFTIRQFVLS
jgi:hypothetical protein